MRSRWPPGGARCPGRPRGSVPGPPPVPCGFVFATGPQGPAGRRGTPQQSGAAVGKGLRGPQGGPLPRVAPLREEAAGCAAGRALLAWGLLPTSPPVLEVALHDGNPAAGCRYPRQVWFGRSVEFLWQHLQIGKCFVRKSRFAFFWVAGACGSAWPAAPPHARAQPAIPWSLFSSSCPYSEPSRQPFTC